MSADSGTLSSPLANGRPTRPRAPSARVLLQEQLVLLELPVAPSTAKWYPTGDAVLGRFVAWRSAAFPGITIRRTAHPTALRPYYIPGQQLKHQTLAEAQAAAFTLHHHPGEPK